MVNESGNGPTPIQADKSSRRVVVIYFFHSKYAKYMILLLRYRTQLGLLGRGETDWPTKQFKAQHVHSKQFSVTKKKVDRGQTTLTPSADGFHKAVNDCFKKLGSLLSASRSK